VSFVGSSLKRIVDIFGPFFFHLTFPLGPSSLKDFSGAQVQDVRRVSTLLIFCLLLLP